jgi:prepilin peptidase CpaA
MIPEWATTGAHLVALAIAAIAAFTDARTEIIPNWLTLPPLALAPLFWLFIDPPWSAVRSVIGLVLCGGVLFFLFKLGACGGGDVKLFAAIGALVGGVPQGYMLGVEALFFTLCTASVYSLIRLAWQGKLLRTIGNAFFLPLNPILPVKWRRSLTPDAMSSVRLGVPSLVGTLVALVLHYQLIRT